MCGNFRKLKKNKHTPKKEQLQYIEGQINKTRNYVESRQSQLVWKTVNGVSGRKSIIWSKLNNANQEKRWQKWKEHFKNLLEKPSTVTDKHTEEIINDELNIKFGRFTREELIRVPIAIKNRKAGLVWLGILKAYQPM